MPALNQPELNPLNGKPLSPHCLNLRYEARKLPVSKELPVIMATLKETNVLIAVGETGSGKTTQIPKAVLLEQAAAGKIDGGMIAVTQTRRLAAESTALRIADELDVGIGQEVGLKYQGRNSVGPRTRLVVLTDGSLLAEAFVDPLLSKYSTIVIDEAHQHSIATDLLMGLLVDLVERRKDLKVIIMSATIHTEKFLNYFPGSIAKVVAGAPSTVQTRYIRRMNGGLLDSVVDTVLYIHATQRPGDILVFLPGFQEISLVLNKLDAIVNGNEPRHGPGEIGPLVCFPLTAQHAREAQEQAVLAVAPGEKDGKGGRKCILATNIAETSITLLGLVFVVDTCLVKNKIYAPREESWSIQVGFVSKSTATQRKGRAGRTRPGVVFRMLSEHQFSARLLEHDIAAILMDDMLSPCLQILQLQQTPFDFKYIVPPATETIANALGVLKALGCVNKLGFLTAHGRIVSSIPTDPFSANMLVKSPTFGCADQIVSIVAMIQASEGGSRVFRPAANDDELKVIRRIRMTFSHPQSDHITLLHIYTAWRQARHEGTADDFVRRHWLQAPVLREADRLRDKLLKNLRSKKTWKHTSLHLDHPQYYEWILMALAQSSYLRIAKRQPGSNEWYRTVRRDESARVSRDSVVARLKEAPEWITYTEFSNNGPERRWLSLVSVIPMELLIAAGGSYWLDLHCFFDGHIRDGLDRVMSKMSGIPEERILAHQLSDSVASTAW
ncbi:hypothetical protein KVT40_007669 [Elsinoe batatas]|uniref:P-loop containing nucleoside triphosphate hydrolase protein n=1 Tax=Elsinoe batatas TaxID=2601811 RepID=A0A8K0PDH6_9PEZI|nr:hypothetical protein KVT40_007669 [Elsinoe batatas]